MSGLDFFFAPPRLQGQIDALWLQDGGLSLSWLRLGFGLGQLQMVI